MNQANRSSFTVLVCGSGTVAHTVALGFSQRGIRTAIMAHPAPALIDGQWDERIFAITPPNIRFLQRLGFWDRLDQARLSDIDEMRIHPDSTRATKLHLTALSAGVDYLAVLAEHRALLKVGDEMVKEAAADGLLTLIAPQKISAIHQNAEAVTVTLADGTRIHANLMVAADGADSPIRALLATPYRVDYYGDLCIVGNFKAEKHHRNIAEQWFYPDGVIATLPIADGQVSLAWSCRQEKAKNLTHDFAENPTRLTLAIQAATENRLGALTPASGVQVWPLRRLLAKQAINGRVILAGDSAHAVHPMLGLGLNLGLGDSAEILTQFGTLPTISRLSYLQTQVYEMKRKAEVKAVQWLTHSLHGMYLQGGVKPSTMATLSNFALHGLQKLPPAKEILIRLMTH